MHTAKQQSPLVTKSNGLVEASYRLTLDEQRLLLAVLAQIDSHPSKPSITAVDPITVSALTIADLFSLPAKKGYEVLKDAVERLAERWVIIDRPDPDEPSLARTKTRWVASIDYLPDQGKVRLHLAQKIIPYIAKLAGQFTSYRIAHVAPMSSVYAIRLYELLVQWRELGEREVQIGWLKEQFQVPNSYSRMYDFKRNVIDIAVDQINTYSDLTVSYTQRKVGRQVVALQFTFGPKAEKPSRQTRSEPASAPKVDRAYIEANARPGESWADATARLTARDTG